MGGRAGVRIHRQGEWQSDAYRMSQGSVLQALYLRACVCACLQKYRESRPRSKPTRTQEGGDGTRSPELITLRALVLIHLFTSSTQSHIACMISIPVRIATTVLNKRQKQKRVASLSLVPVIFSVGSTLSLPAPQSLQSEALRSLAYS